MTTVGALTDVESQLKAAGILDRIGEPRVLIPRQFGRFALTGRVDMRVAATLRQDRERFVEGPLHRLHVNVGPKRLDFRSPGGTFGPGSLQVVISRTTGNLYADVDRFFAYELAGLVAHGVVEVIWPRVRGLWSA